MAKKGVGGGFIPHLWWFSTHDYATLEVAFAIAHGVDVSDRNLSLSCANGVVFTLVR